ncbi:MAG: ABC transporter ATP-binding protein [Spirochaetaceae bacterium]|nr:MAG: ABC transporter ATP-binding protein [Spirochaetaceae bacterium]
MAIIELSNIIKFYSMGKVTVPALSGVSIKIDKGDFVAIAGPSGSGKTTILNIIGLIDTPSEGNVVIDNTNTILCKNAELTRMRQKVLGFIFQSFNLLSGLNVFENVELPLLIGRFPLARKERKEWVKHLLEEVGLSDRLRHKPRELSGGQQQRVAIARALATKPKIVIADEPTANLDSQTGKNILALMKKINAEQKTTFIFSTHDPVIHAMADHVIMLKDGVIEKEYRRENGDTD